MTQSIWRDINGPKKHLVIPELLRPPLFAVAQLLDKEDPATIAFLKSKGIL